MCTTRKRERKREGVERERERGGGERALGVERLRGSSLIQT